MWIANVGSIGIIKDASSILLPPNAWTAGNNVSFDQNRVQKSNGATDFLTTNVEPYGLWSHKTPTDCVFAYMGLRKIYGFNAVQHADITRVSGGDYGGTPMDMWQGTDLSTIVVFNNGVDIPQAWIQPDPAIPLINLANWPANTTARMIKGYKNFLVAVDVTKSGVNYPTMVKWSHSAAPGAVPASWDETNPNLDAGEVVIEGSDRLVDAVKLGDVLVLYTSNTTTVMSFVGGAQRMAFTGVYDKLGVLAQQCAIPWGRSHFVVSMDDIVLHALSGDPQSLVDTRIRNWFFNQVNPSAYSLTRVVHHAHKREIWVLFPSIGSTVLNMGLVWNIKFNSWSVVDFPNYYAAIELPSISTPQATWDVDSATWDADTSTWDVIALPGNLGSVMTTAPGVNRIHVADETTVRAGQPFVSYVERSGLAYLPSQNGTPVIDAEHFKLVRAVWPVIEGIAGNKIKVEIGTQEKPSDVVTWSPGKDFTIGTDVKVDLYASGRFLAVRFTDYGQSQWRLLGYAIDCELAQML